jgi:hypothetical protein
MRIQIQDWDVCRLTLNETNPRTHSPEQVAQIAASIEEFGFVNPILVAPDSTIIAGEGRGGAAPSAESAGYRPRTSLRASAPSARDSR